MKRKVITSISLDAEIHEALKRMPGLNVSDLVNRFLADWLSSGGTSWDDAELSKRKIELDLAKREVEKWSLRVKNLQRYVASLEERIQEERKDLEWRLKTLRKFKARPDQSTYEESLSFHASELGMPVEELRKLVEVS